MIEKLKKYQSPFSLLLKKCRSIDAVAVFFAGFGGDFAKIALLTFNNQNTKKGLKPTFQA